MTAPTLQQIEMIGERHTDLVAAVSSAAVWAEAASAISGRYAHELDLADWDLGVVVAGWASLSASIVGQAAAATVTARVSGAVANARRDRRAPESRPTGFYGAAANLLEQLGLAYRAWLSDADAALLGASGHTKVWMETYAQATYRHACQAVESLTGAYREAVQATWKPAVVDLARHGLAANGVWKWMEALRWGQVSAAGQEAVLAALEPEFGDAVRQVRLGLARLDESREHWQRPGARLWPEFQLGERFANPNHQLCLALEADVVVDALSLVALTRALPGEYLGAGVVGVVGALVVVA